MVTAPTHPPLVSCIMPTGDRRSFVPAAIHYFLRQDYPNKELIVVDDGADAVGDLMPNDSRIQYIRLERRSSVGAKRNIACAHARGTIVAHWHDDDWHATRRLSYQVQSLLADGVSLCGLNRISIYDFDSQRAWQWRYPAAARPRLACGTLCYRRSLWERHGFADVDVGEDVLMTASLRGDQIAPLADPSFYLASLHEHTRKSSAVHAPWWHHVPVETLERQLDRDWPGFLHRRSFSDPPLTKPFQNVYACLVHENAECVVDLVRNLRFNDPASMILLYDGSSDSRLLAGAAALTRLGAQLHPSPRPMHWGWLHDFALDSMRFALDHSGFDALTIVDSDQLCIRAGYPERIASHLAAHPKVGMLGSSPGPQPPATTIGPAAQAWREFNLWRPLLRRFPRGESNFPYWTFWPSTVFTAEAASALVDFAARDVQLADIMRRTKIWASEEVILPTLTSLLGFEIGVNPCSYDFVRYRVACDDDEISQAFARRDVYWIHPVQRNYHDRARESIRRRCADYDLSRRDFPMTSSVDLDTGDVLLTLPILERMRKVDGWFEDDEADLLIALTARTLQSAGESPVLLEVGSYCGRSTTVMGCVSKVIRPDARIYAVDPHDGVVGASDQGLTRVPPSLKTFSYNIEQAGLSSIVRPIVAKSTDVVWHQPLHLLFIDGLHDYASVASDFEHFAPFVVPGGYVLFHDYAPYFPGVMALVEECLANRHYRKVAIRQSLCALQRLP